MKRILRSYLVNGVGLYLLAKYIGGFHIASGLEPFLFLTLIFTGVYLIVRPLLTTALGSLNFLTFGVIGIIIDGAILYLLPRFLPELWLTDWNFPGLSFGGFSLAPMFLTVPLVALSCAVALNTVRSSIMALCDR